MDNNTKDIMQFAETVKAKFNELGINAELYSEDSDMHKCVGVSFPSGASSLPVIDLTGLHCMVYKTHEKTLEEAFEYAVEIYRTSYKAFVEENSASYRIYQLRDDIEDRRDISFLGLDILEKLGRKVEKDNYKMVYSGLIPVLNSEAVYDDREDDFILKGLFRKFNLNHPSDFRGHSMSVSDVVVLHIGGEDKAFYCDSFGFTKLDDFLTGKEAA